MSDSIRFSHLAPVLAVDDLTEAVAFYRDKLGFELSFVQGEPPHFAMLRRGEGVVIGLSEREDTSRPIASCSVYVFVGGVDALHEEYRRAGVEIFAPPENLSYGMREFDVTDIAGHHLTFGERVEG